GAAGQYFADTVLLNAWPQRARVTLQRLFASTVMDQGFHSFIDFNDFVDTLATAIAQLVALITTAGVENLRWLRRINAENGAFGGIGGGFFFALIAQHPHQPLGDYTDNTGRQQKGLDAHILQSGYRTNGGIGVQRRQHQVTG